MRACVYAREWRNVQGGGQVHLHIDTHRKFRKIVGNFREKVGGFSSFSPWFPHREGRKVSSGRGEGKKERAQIASVTCPVLQNGPSFERCAR